MNLISRTYRQLCTIESLMKQDIKDELATVNYFVCENEYKLIDYSEVEYFLTTNKVENTQLFRQISEKCNSIIDMWNDDFKNFKDRELKEPLNIKTENQSLSTKWDFNALYLSDNNIKSYNSLDGKIHFIKNCKYNQYQTSDIAQKCNLLNNKITAFLPDVKEKFYNDYNYSQMDKYLIESEKIKEPQEKLKFWNDLLFKYETDYNELINISIINSLEIIGASELRYKKGNLLSANFKTLCQNEIEKIKNHLERKNKDNLQPAQEKPPKKESETLSDLITHQNSVEIVEKIKVQYKNIKGKSLKLLLMAFQDLDLLPKERIASKFYKACKNKFNWDIATYTAMNGYKYNDITDKEELEQKKSYLKSIIETK